jgi:acyl-lipid omega-6 desaturase (Delta-12 desaturase)
MEAATLASGPFAATEPSRTSKAWWVEHLEPYAGADLRRSLGCVATSVIPYMALWPAMYFLLDVSYALTLLVAIPTSGFLVRTFIVFHDCGHGSFMPSKRANRVVGIFTGLLVFNAFTAWTHDHAGHHATSGDLDRRGSGDVGTWTVAEYRSKSWTSRLSYRLIRSPFVMFTIGPVWALALQPRLVPRSKRQRLRRSHMLTNFGVVTLIAAVISVVGWQEFLLIQVPLVLLAGSAGVWLFYVQHQFEDVYWTHSEDWSYLDAALKGSSYLKLPKVLQFFSGNIGLHHVHHLSPRIPNYNLQRAHDENEFLHAVPTIGIWDGLKAVRLKLIDEEQGRLVTFAQARERSRPRARRALRRQPASPRP